MASRDPPRTASGACDASICVTRYCRTSASAPPLVLHRCCNFCRLSSLCLLLYNSVTLRRSPLVLGKRSSPTGGDEWCVASEDCAFGPIGFERVRDVQVRQRGAPIAVLSICHCYCYWRCVRYILYRNDEFDGGIAWKRAVW